MNNNRLELLKQMYDENNHDSFILFAIAKELEYQNKNEEAISTFEKLKSKDNQYVGLYYHLAHLYQKVNEYDKAILIFDEGITIAKKSSDFHALSELINAKQNIELEM